MIKFNKIVKASKSWKKAKPFSHVIIDNFFDNKIAKQLESEFPDFDSKEWDNYNNAIEEKKACNKWKVFPSLTYQTFQFLNSSTFVDKISNIFLGASALKPDSGLHGGGWHIHKRGGKLNTHLDYSMHPKLKLQRKINIIIYLNSKWKKTWGGNLGFWGNKSYRSPGKLYKEIMPKFNRAVIFDTTQNSWHGLPNPINCPDKQYRKSLAVYYLIEPKKSTNKRSKVLFAPNEEQKKDKKVLDLIRKRSNMKSAASLYESR
tara:strand:+ start:943 stop:1722 length:780 start_codon:yes stop_codon:yes gene_type:complete